MIDQQINFLLLIQESLGNTFFNSFFSFISWLGNKGIIWILLGALLIIFGVIRQKVIEPTPRHRSSEYLLPGISIFLALALSAIFTNLILKNIFDFARPFTYYPFDLLIATPHDSSFPSGHTSSSFAAAIACFKYYKKTGIVFLILAALISFSRLYLFVHFPIDVFIGMILGIIYGLTAWWFSKKSNSIMFAVFLKRFPQLRETIHAENTSQGDR